MNDQDQSKLQEIYEEIKNKKNNKLSTGCDIAREQEYEFERLKSELSNKSKSESKGEVN